ETDVKPENGRVPISIYIFFNRGIEEQQARSMLEYTIDDLLSNRLYEHFDEGDGSLDYEIIRQEDGTLGARIHTTGIARHPAQLYESISCVFLFILLCRMPGDAGGVD